MIEIHFGRASYNEGGGGTSGPLGPLFVWYIKCRQSQMMRKDFEIN